jgi:hypothetical protein
MVGDFAPRPSFTASNFLPGGGVCDETYTITGEFTAPDRLEATFTTQYDGDSCLDCVGDSWFIVAERP